ncbi:hypothetical protein Tco_1276812, partial [Tanacetum coccineum]
LAKLSLASDEGRWYGGERSGEGRWYGGERSGEAT